MIRRSLCSCSCDHLPLCATRGRRRRCRFGYGCAVLSRAPSLTPRRRHQEANDAPDNGEHRDLRLIVLLWGLITKSKQVVGHEGIEEGRIGLPLFPCLRNWAPNSNFQLFQLRFSRNLHLQSLLRLLSFSLSLPLSPPSRLRFLHFLTIGATSSLSPST
jgi:hypothetical protein